MKLSKKECPDCGTENERNYLICDSCGASMGFPNVNIFADPMYTEAINQRYDEVIDDLNKKGTLDLVKEFEQKVETEGKAVIAMNLNFFSLLVSQNEDYLPYQLGVEQGKRFPYSAEEDMFRVKVDSRFYGSSGRLISFAALSLDGKGLLSYGNGEVFVTLKTPTIQKRTTIIEKNSYNLYQELDAQHLLGGKLFPLGYVGLWDDRAKITTIKCGAFIDADKDKWSSVLLQNSTDNNKIEDDFVELHIYNKIRIPAFEKILINSSKVKSSDLPRRKLIKLQVALERTAKAKIELVQ